MKYRFYVLMSLLALGVGSLMAQDYDDIYYDASKSSSSSKAKTSKVVTPAKTVAVYGEVPEKYKEAVQVNYSTDRDVDEYNRRGAYEPNYEVTLTGDTIYYDNDTIYEEAFANTRRIERFYNPDIVILSDDDELVDLYYDESPTINLIVGSDWGYGSFYDWGYSYYPWYTGWYSPWYTGWYSPWYYSWHHPWHSYHWYWGYPGYYSPWRWTGYGWAWDHWGWTDWARHDMFKPYRHNPSRFVDTGARPGGHRTGLADNRNPRGRVDARAGSRNNVSPRGASSRSAAVGNMGSRSRGSGTVGSRSSGNMGSRSSSGVTTRRSSSSAGVYSSGSNTRSYGGSRSSGSYSSGRSSSSSSGGSYRSSGSSSSSSRSSGGSYSSGGGSRGGSSGGGSHGGSSGGSRRH